MPNLNRFDILSISIFCKIALSISIFSKITIPISIFLELPYRYRYFSELPYRYRYRYRYFQHLHIDIDIDIDIFQKCRYIDNGYFISIYRTGLVPAGADIFLSDAFCCLWALKVKAMYQVLVTRMLNLRMHCLAPSSNLRHKPRMRIAQQKIDHSVTQCTIWKQRKRSSQIKTEKEIFPKKTGKELWSKSLSGGK